MLDDDYCEADVGDKVRIIKPDSIFLGEEVTVVAGPFPGTDASYRWFLLQFPLGTFPIPLVDGDPVRDNQLWVRATEVELVQPTLPTP